MSETTTKEEPREGSTSEAVAPASEPEAPLPTFDVLPLSPELKETLAEIGYLHPTPVQIAVWEPATRGKDAVVQARTGTGKTASFGLPIVDHIVKRSVAGVQVLCLCPTRELALQVAGEIARLGKRKETKVLAIYGGAPMERQVQGIEAGAQVIVGTPGRVLDHIRRGTLKPTGVKLLVLDEADEMLSMGFERELTAILESLPPSRQTLLFSATVPPDIERISKNKLKSPEFVTLSGDHIGALSIQHFVYMVPADKLGALARIIEVENPESAVVFCNTKDETQTVASALQQRGYDADWLNGDLPQGEREKVMSATREGRLRFLVATDVAARGIDISHLTHVINYDFPQDAESYVHRTGRTGRAGRTGTAIALITPRDIGGLYLLRLTYKIKPIERQIPTPGELKTRAEADLVAMLAEAYIPKGVHADDRALARRILSHDQVELIVAGLLRDVLGARPNAQEEASSARRAQVRRGSLRQGRDARGRGGAEGRGGRAEPAPVERASAEGVAAEGAIVAAPLRVQPPRSGEDASDVSDATSRPEGREARGASDRRGEGRREGRREGRDGDRPRGERGRESRGERSRVDAGTASAPAGGAPTTPERDRGGRRRPVPVTEFANWQPPEEENDDEPLIPSRSREALAEGAAASPAGAAIPSGAPQRTRENAPTTDRMSTERSTGDQGAPEAEADAADYAELFVTVGRRDGVRAQDLLRALVEVAGVDKHTVRRIRVRDRHAFVSIRKTDVDAAIAKLHGTSLAGRTLTVELARERGGELQEGTAES